MIIVDLDDTVLDTRRTLRRVKLSDCVAHAPVSIRDEFEGYLLSRADERVPGRVLIADACASFDLDAEVASLMHAEYYENHPDDPQVPLIEGAREGLERFAQLGRIVCVSAGVEAQQRRKIANAQLEGSFDEVMIVESSEEKRRVYERLLEESDEPAHRFIVIGDKLSDVEPARELGMHAIRFGAEWDGAFALDWFSLVALVETIGNVWSTR